MARLAAIEEEGVVGVVLRPATFKWTFSKGSNGNIIRAEAVHVE